MAVYCVCHPGESAWLRRTALHSRNLGDLGSALELRENVSARRPQSLPETCDVYLTSSRRRAHGTSANLQVES